MSRFDFDALDGVLDTDVEATATQTVPIPKKPPERAIAPEPPPTRPSSHEVQPVRAAKPAPRRPWLLVGSAALVLGLAIGWTAGTRIPASRSAATTVPLNQAERAEAVVAPNAAAAAPAPAAPPSAVTQAAVPTPALPAVQPAPATTAASVAPPAPSAPQAVAQAQHSSPTPSQVATAARRWTIPFGFDSAAVTRAADIAAAASCPGRLEVVGHTDSSGARAYNDALSLRRAVAIGAQLESAGVEHDQITLRGAGSSQPLVAGTSLQARKTNRRVEIRCAP